MQVLANETLVGMVLRLLEPLIAQVLRVGSGLYSVSAVHQLSFVHFLSFLLHIRRPANAALPSQLYACHTSIALEIIW